MTPRKACPGFIALAIMVSSILVAQDWRSAAAELATKLAARHPDTLLTVQPSGGQEADRLLLRDISAVLERALKSKNPPSDVAPLTVRLSIGEGLHGRLLIAQTGPFENGNVILVPLPAIPDRAESEPGFSLRGTRLLQQDRPILDFVRNGNQLWILSPVSVDLFELDGVSWRPIRSLSLEHKGPVSRDPRGRLFVSGDTVHAFFDQTLCEGSVQEGTALRCRKLQGGWPIFHAGARIAEVHPRPGRNSFDQIRLTHGAFVADSEFYNVAFIPGGGSSLWILTGLDGQAKVHDERLRPTGAYSWWSSEIAGVDLGGECGAALVAVLATDQEVNSVRAFRVRLGRPEPAGEVMQVQGRVTALWPGSGNRCALGIQESDDVYAAYELEVICNH